jgi:hypothetical protein
MSTTNLRFYSEEILRDEHQACCVFTTNTVPNLLLTQHLIYHHSEEILLDEFLEAFRSTLFSGQHSLPSLANSESAEKKAASPRRSNLYAPPEQLQVDTYECGRLLGRQSSNEALRHTAMRP